MRILLFVVSAILLLQECDCVLCTDKERRPNFIVRNNHCHGDVCVNYANEAETVTDKSCVTTDAVEFPLGCVQYKEWVVCVCNTDHCNEKKSKETPRIIQPSFCATTSEGPGAKTGRKQAAVCSVKITEEGGVRKVTKAAETDLNQTFVLPITGKTPVDSFTYYVGMVHIVSGIKKNVNDIHYKCYGDDCNDKPLDKYSVKTKVKCHAHETTATGEKQCQGEFCVYASGNGPFRQYCLSTYNITTDKNYKIGSFLYKGSQYYLCNEDLCNQDKYVALNAIQEGRRKVNQARKDKEDREEEEKKRETAAAEAKTNSAFHFSHCIVSLGYIVFLIYF